MAEFDITEWGVTGGGDAPLSGSTSQSYLRMKPDDEAKLQHSHTGGSKPPKIHKQDPATKDKVIIDLIPDNISECALYLGRTETCMSDKAVAAINKVLGNKSTGSNPTGSGSSKDIINTAKAATDCDTERCVLEKMSYDLAPHLGRDGVAKEISQTLKVAGPTDNQLLSNVHIDNTMQQWALRNREFYPYNFHMLNYASYCYRNSRVFNTPDTLVTIPFDTLYAQGYRCAGCIINTDTYQGDGIHWMALFVDARGDKWSAEFFNSSGNSPSPEWVNWMEKTKIILERLSAGNPKITIAAVKASCIQHQKSRTECGLYSLFYVWARLNGVPVEYFASNRIPDQLMFEFRQHLFHDTSREAIKKFNWEQYTKITRVTWE